MTRAVGIDLGTTYTVVAAIEGEKAIIVPNAEGQSLTPSVVAFTDYGEPMVGQLAKLQAAANPERSVLSIKRRMGSNYKVRIDGKEFTPQDISSLILGKVKNDAQDYLGERIDKAVITVPAYFNDRQRQATKEAGALAGLDVMRIINEPTATALAYGLDREDAHTILVWDLGGGTFDVSILELGEGIFEVKAVSGDNGLGGDDYDERLAIYMAEEYQRTWGANFPDDPGAWQRLREAAEKAKIQLSYCMTVRVDLPFVTSSPDPRHLDVEITKERLDSLTADLLGRMVIPTHQALRDAGLTSQDIDRIILAGGATRMPALRELAKGIFGKEPYRYVNPDEVVAIGAAIQAGMILGLVDKAVLLDVLPLSLGVETQGGLFAKIIPRNTPLPALEGRIFTTASDFQTSMDIHVLQGERELALENVSLGHFRLDGIPSAPRGVPKVEVAFQADVDGLVHVSAKDLLTENEVKVKVASTKLFDPQEIEHLKEAAQRNEKQDEEKRAHILAKVEANNIINAAEGALEESLLPDHSAQRIARGIQKVREALARDVSAEGDVVEEIRFSCKELRVILGAVHEERRSLALMGTDGSSII